jgi:hypothetical protein
VVISALLGLVGFAPHFSRFRPHHWITAAVLGAVVLAFWVMLANSFRYAHQLLIRIQVIEQTQPLP